MASVSEAIAFFLPMLLTQSAIMPTDPPNSARRIPPDRLDPATGRSLNGSVSFLPGFSAALVALTGIHAANLDQSWTTENAFLVVFVSVFAGWNCRPKAALIAVLVTSLAWWMIDLPRGHDALMCSLRYLARTILLLLLVKLSGRVRTALDLAQNLAQIDGLTGLPNRSSIIRLLEAELSRLKRFNRSFSIAMIDCDGFKLINDQQGHLAGDRVLQKIAAAFRKQLRAYDGVGRLGGDEFVLILPETSRNQVSGIIERLRSVLRIDVQQEYSSLTFSIGVITVEALSDGDDSIPDSFACLHQADQAMYHAKRSGRDQTYCVDFVPEPREVAGQK